MRGTGLAFAVRSRAGAGGGGGGALRRVALGRCGFPCPGRPAGAAKERLKARLLRASEAARSRPPSGEAAELRKALRRSRRQKSTIKSLSKENARLRKAVRKSASRQAGLEVQLAKLRATGAVLSKALFGRRSERQARLRSERRRGWSWPHPAARARGEGGRTQPAGRYACLRRLREALRGERGPCLDPRRDRGRCP